MSDLFQGQSMSECYRFISGGLAHTFQFNFQPDKVVFNNLSDWTATPAGKPVSVWLRDQTTAGHAYQEQVIVDNGSTGNANFVDLATNGFTVADLPGGQASAHATISGITAADPGVVTHSAYTFQNDQIVRLTNLGNCGVVQHGMDELNNQRFKITVLSPTTFSLKDVITGEPIDTSGFTPYVSGGIITLETHVISLNNPQVNPYSAINPYHPNPFKYDPVTYQLTAGTGVMGTDGDEFLIEVYKFGQVTDLGDIG